MIITIEGPTAAGKTAFALQLAKALNTEIINADSRQVYRYMDIGTAKPNREELTAVPHHLIDIIEPNQSFNAGCFVKDADNLIAQLQAAGKTPIVCGGTGLYIRSLVEGLFEHPPIDPALRAELKTQLYEQGQRAMYARLQEVDPAFAARISEHDPQRILRGLEVYLGTGKSISAHWLAQKRDPRHQAVRILLTLPRDELYLRINSRVHHMLNTGLLAEIEGLLLRGYTWHDPGLRTMGYKEFQPCLEAGIPAADCALLVAQHHRNFAKRQLTWYRNCRFDLTICPHSFSLSDILREIQTRYMRFKEESGENHSQSS
jgi:tRNA dimethylallyltransferase